MPGTLHVVATPIGNLEDITLRALRTLREASVIACEDSRHTQKLLNHHGISTPVISYHEHNEAERAAQLVQRLLSGDTVALVSDAGTPLVSDPGFRLVRAAAEAGVPVSPIPGPCALVAALSASALPTDRFLFVGFLPPKPGARQREIDSWKEISATIVLYEAPHRIEATLQELQERLGDRDAVLARELTKVHEELIRGPLSALRSALATRPTQRGEFTVLLGRSAMANVSDETIDAAVRRHLAAGLERMEAIKAVARERGLPKRDVYRAVEDEL
jgi:16S rRNA (cytidine1402-2'-O)-methyltransferase